MESGSKKIILGWLFIFSSICASAQNQTHFSVNFDFNRSEITPQASVKLDSLINYIVSHKTSFTIELAGHTDSVGSNEYNDALSLRRTGSVKKYLDDRGLESFNIIMEEGLGKRMPLNNNRTEEDRFLNRRVELTVTIPGRSVAKSPVPELVKPDTSAITKITPVDSLPSKRSITDQMNDTANFKAGSKIVLKDLMFIGGRHYLVPGSLPILQELLDIMNKNPTLVISIEGHVCCVPGNIDGIDLDLNTPNLSEMRAKMVYDYLIDNGINSDRLSYKGFGHRFPIRPYPERTVEDQEINRRVEIKIISR